MEVEAIGEVTWEVNGETQKKEKVPAEDQHLRGSHRDDGSPWPCLSLPAH